MRSIVLEKRANPSRPGALQFSLGDIRMLTDAPSRKTVLSEKSETDRISRANMNSRQKKGNWPQRAANSGSRTFCNLCPCLRPCGMDLVICVFDGHALGSYCKVRARATCCSIFVVKRSRHRSILRTGLTPLAASFEAGSLHRPDCRDEYGLRPRQNGQSQCHRC